RRQRRLPMVNVTNRPHVHVRLRPLKLRLGHGLPSEDSQWLAAHLGDDLLGLLLRNFLVARELHRIDSATLRQRTKRRRIPEHLRRRHARADYLRGSARRRPADLTTPAGQVAHVFAHVLGRRHDLHIHDRLEQHRIRPLRTLLERDRAGDLERHLARVDLVVRTIDQLDLHVDHRVPGEDAVLHRLLDPLLDGPDVLLRDHAADDLVLEDQPRTGLGRTDVDHHVAVLAAPTRLPDELPLDVLGALANRLPVRDLRTANVRLDLELPLQTVDDDLEMELAHPADDRLPRLLIDVDPEGRILFGELRQAGGELVLVRLRLRLDGDVDHRLRELHRLE